MLLMYKNIIISKILKFLYVSNNRLTIYMSSTRNVKNILVMLKMFIILNYHIIALKYRLQQCISLIRNK